MLIMGLDPMVLHLSWLVTAGATFFWIAISVTCLSSGSFLAHSDSSLVFVFIFAFAASEMTYGFLVSTFFSQAKLAAIVAPIALFAALLPRFVFYTSNRCACARILFRSLFSIP
jgi:hypothetical protein